MSEIWVDISGYEGIYQISSLGQVSGPRKSRLVIGVNNHGYPRVNLYLRGIKKTVSIHRLIAEHFLPRVQGKDFINHIDGVKTNFSLDNLEWCTLAENSRHAHDTGLMRNCYGSSNGASKLNEDQVNYIRKNPDCLSGAGIARSLGVSPALVCMIRKGQVRGERLNGEQP